MLCYINILVIYLSNVFQVFCNHYEISNTEDFKNTNYDFWNTNYDFWNTFTVLNYDFWNTFTPNYDKVFACQILIATFVTTTR